MAILDFIDSLEEMGYKITDLGEGRIFFSYQVLTGRFAGEAIRLGFVVPGDFPITPPSGPHISPRILPINTQGPHPAGGIHESSQFGAEWEYWSRPLNHWAQTKRTVKDVMAHVRHLLDTQ